MRFIDAYFASTDDRGETRYYRGASEISEADWRETDDPRKWWV